MTTVIPPPTSGRMTQSATRRMLSVDLAAPITVIYTYNDLTVTLSIRDNGKRIDTSDLSRAIDTAGLVGRLVFQARVSCGGAIPEEYINTHGSQDDLAAAREAIPHVYPVLRDPSERQALRSAYRYLVKLAGDHCVR